MHRLPLTAIAVLLAAAPVAAETGRYQFERTEQGLIRLDTQTGAVSLCAGEAMECRETGSPAPALSVELDRLERRIAVLEQRIAAMEADRGGSEALPSEEEFDRTLGLMERFMRRFFGVIQEFNGAPEPEPAPPSPGRT